MNYIPNTTETTVRMSTIEVDGLNIFYREVGKPGNPKLVLLHGFPAPRLQPTRRQKQRRAAEPDR